MEATEPRIRSAYDEIITSRTKQIYLNWKQKENNDQQHIT
jgi:hypothetical protein